MLKACRRLLDALSTCKCQDDVKKASRIIPDEAYQNIKGSDMYSAPEGGRDDSMNLI